VTRESAAKKDLIDALGRIGIAATANLAEINRDLWDAIGELLTRAQRAGAVRRDIGIVDLMALLRGRSWPPTMKTVTPGWPTGS
jgi:hypothetical protein